MTTISQNCIVWLLVHVTPERALHPFVDREVFTVFWGSAWRQASQLDLANKVNQFFTDILSSALMDQLAEYSVPAYPIEHGQFTGTTTFAKPRLGHSVTDSAIQHMLQQEMSTINSFPQPSANAPYFVYLPPNVKVIQGGGTSSRKATSRHRHERRHCAGRKVWVHLIPGGRTTCRANRRLLDITLGPDRPIPTLRGRRDACRRRPRVGRVWMARPLTGTG